MNCPSCNNELKALAVTGVRVLACAESCGGLWFEWSEIKKLKDRNPAAGEALLHVERAEGVHVFRDIQHPCPKCKHTLLYRHCFNRRFRYEIDRQTAAAYFKTLFEESIKPENMTHPDSQEAARIIVQLFRFLTPQPLFPTKTPLDPL